MKFTSILYLALPALSLARPSGPCAATPSPKVDLSVCKEVAAGTYAQYCDRCEHLCAHNRDNPKQYDLCINGVFFQADYWGTRCSQHNGFDCMARSIDKACGPKK
ncbi:hypothetical protein ACHAPT_008417 [Fusarium lateritium]